MAIHPIFALGSAQHRFPARHLLAAIGNALVVNQASHVVPDRGSELGLVLEGFDDIGVGFDALQRLVERGGIDSLRKRCLAQARDAGIERRCVCDRGAKSRKGGERRYQQRTGKGAVAAIVQ